MRILGVLLIAAWAPASQAANRLVLSQRSEPRTFNPVFAVDAPSRDLLRLVHGRLVRINGATLSTEPALARSWKFTPDGLRCTMELRKGVRFSDGAPFGADDVLFSFEVYQDAKLAPPQRDLLSPGGNPIRAVKLGSHTVRFDFPEPHAPGERLFDGLAILPRHKLEAAYRQGKLAQQWNLPLDAAAMAGLGPFVIDRHRPGLSVLLRRNPHYWEPGKPRLEEIEVLFTPDQTAEALLFRRGSLDLIQRPPAKVFDALEAEIVKIDAGASLEYHFLFFNLNTAPAVPERVRSRQAWFRDPRFRRAVSLAASREAIGKLVFSGRATSLQHHVTPANKLWAVEPHAPPRSLEQARKLLTSAGFRFEGQGLRDPEGRPVEFTVAVNGANAAHVQIATLLREDLRAIGIDMRPVTIEFRSLVDRVLKTLDYDAAIMALGTGDADPNAEMNVWLTTGSMHVWNLSAAKEPLPWEAEIDQAMRRQRTARDPRARKAEYAKVQRTVANMLPIIPLVSPHLLVAHKPGLEGVRPGPVPPYALWNIENIGWSDGRR